jgi:hypothetical protein
MAIGIACLFEEEANDDNVFLLSRDRKEGSAYLTKDKEKEVLMF